MREDSFEKTISTVIEREESELKHQSIQIRDGNLSVFHGVYFSVMVRKRGSNRPFTIGPMADCRS
jgi:hypothetical protein